MPSRWVLCPVVMIQPVDAVGTPTGSSYRAPKFRLYQDPGKPLLSGIDEESGVPFSHRKSYTHSSVIDTPTVCVSMVRGVDFSPLDADADIVTLADDDIPLDRTLRSAGWTQSRFTKILTRLRQLGGDETDLTLDSPLFRLIVRLGQRIRTDFNNTRGTFVGP